MAPGQSQKPHRHDGEDKIYYVLEGSGRFSLGGAEERLEAGEALVARRGRRARPRQRRPSLLLVLVVVTPPPPHVKR